MDQLLEASTSQHGVRMGLGARPVDVLSLILAERMALASLGVLLGHAGAYAVTRVLNSLLFAVRSADPFPLVEQCESITWQPGAAINRSESIRSRFAHPYS